MHPALPEDLPAAQPSPVKTDTPQKMALEVGVWQGSADIQ